MNKHTRVWSLQEAKAKFSEVVKRAQTEGPQTVTVHGKAAVKIVADDSGESAGDAATGASLVDILNNSPLRLLGKSEFSRAGMKARNRPVEL